ncbi:MAG: hypothetical protein AAF959_11080 [Cyanobacteria bacterium P01_D01_bin.56]
MHLIATLPDLPYALRVAIPPEHQAQAEEWLNTAEHWNLLRQNPFSRDQGLDEPTQRYQKLREAVGRLQEQGLLVHQWLNPLLEENGFRLPVEDDDTWGEDPTPRLCFEHETLWQRRNPDAVVRDLATLDKELSFQFDGTVAGAIEVLRNFPGGWMLPFNCLDAIKGSQIVISTTGGHECKLLEGFNLEQALKDLSVEVITDEA